MQKGHGHMKDTPQDIDPIESQEWQDAIEDVIQQTYTDAFLDIARFEPRHARSFANWLRTIAEHNLQDAIRLLTADRRGGGNVQHREATSHSDLFERITGSLTTASQHVARDEAAEALRAGLTQLPECHREVITRIDLEGEPVANVARDLKRSPGSVYMMRARAHRWLRDLLDHGSQVLPDFS